jgi:polysaccharide export outer membrane protein
MRSRNKLVFLSVLGFIFLLQSCGVNSNLMFKEAKGEVNYDSIPLTPIEDYQISADDKIKFTLSTNNGTEIVERLTGVSDSRIIQTKEMEYIVRRNGSVELPVIGSVHVEGLSIEACEDTLTSKFAVEYKDPFVQVEVTNQRVIVFPGNGADAKVVPLTNSNTTLMEALAQAGGITDRGKANTIKLMRRVNGERQVYGIDLSTMEGLKYVDMIVQANDYIYVEPTPELGKEIAEDIVPVVSLISSAIFIISAINILK